MKTANIKAFFSCSFREEDKELTGFFNGVCTGLGIECQNVDFASQRVPPAQAKKMIDESLVLIAICTRRDLKDNGGYTLPPAVHDEIGIAYGMNKPVLLIVEEGVILEGFLENVSTHVKFSRDQLTNSDSIRKIIKSIHEFKVESLSPKEFFLEQHGIRSFYAKEINILIALEEDGDSYIWEYFLTKKLVFTETCMHPIVFGAWPTTQTNIPDNAPNIEWEAIVEKSSRSFELKHTVSIETPNCIELLTQLSPQPKEGDYIDITLHYKSKYLNPIHFEDFVSKIPCVNINNIDYYCHDGLVAIHRTQNMMIKFEFPKKYGVSIENIAPFVGSVTNKIDYVLEKEVNRMNISYDTVGKKNTIKCEVESPLLQHVYAVAWNPPH